MRCAKSWQTPRRVSTTSVGDVLMVVTPGAYSISACSLVLNAFRAGQDRPPFAENMPRNNR